MRWAGAAQVAAEIASLGAAVALARLIPPADFGYFAVIAILFLIGGSLAGDFVTAALVYLREATDRHIESANFLALVAGALATLTVLALAPLADPICGDEIPYLAQLGSPYLLLIGISAVPRALLQRRLAFRRLGVIDAITVLSGLSVSVGLALAGVDIEALVLGSVAGQMLSTVLLLKAATPPRPRRHQRELREIRRFGIPNAAAGVASTLSQNVDYAVLAARAGPATVGFYWRGYQLGVEAQRRFSGVVTGLALPLYARLASRTDQLALRSRIVRLQTMLLVPFLGALILLAPLIVPAVFGDHWKPAVVPTQVLAGAGIIAAAQTGVGPLIAALGRPGAMLRWNLTNIVFLGVGVFFAAPYGLTVLSVTVLGLRVFRFFISYEFLLRRIAGVERKRIVSDLAPALGAGAVAIGAAWAVQHLALADLGSVIEVLGVGAVIACVYPGALRLLFPKAFGELTSALRRLVTHRSELPGAAAAAAPAEEVTPA